MPSLAIIRRIPMVASESRTAPSIAAIARSIHTRIGQSVAGRVALRREKTAALLVPHLRKSIEDDHVASGILLAALGIAIGMLNAAAMSL